METSNIKKKMVDKTKTGRFIISLLVIHFFFFGAIANIYGKDVDDKVLFVFKSFFSASSWYTIFILIIILCGVAFSEDLLVDGVKNCLRIVPFILISSIIWHLINGLGNFDVDLIWRILYPFRDYFLSWEGYVNIVILLIITVGSAILGGFLKIKMLEYRSKKRMIVE
nr:hypothetical protein DSAG12_03089 [Candidatus Prometheoarchaeum syntrophicum]